MKNQDVIREFSLNGKEVSTKNVRFVGNKLFNYGTCLAQHLQDGTTIFNRTKYSVTTSKIQNYIAYELGTYKVVEVTGVPAGTPDLTSYVK